MREYDKRCWSTGWNIEENSACVNLWTNYTVLCVKRWSIKTQRWCLWIATCIFVYKCINYRRGSLSQRGLLAIKPVTNTSINNYKIEKKVIKIITLIVSIWIGTYHRNQCVYNSVILWWYFDSKMENDFKLEQAHLKCVVVGDG